MVFTLRKEVELSTEMVIQQCPNCGKYLIPCSMCEWDKPNVNVS